MLDPRWSAKSRSSRRQRRPSSRKCTAYVLRGHAAQRAFEQRSLAALLNGIPLIDAHVHAARLPTLKESWKEWAARYGSPSLLELYDEEGTLVPERFDEYMAEEGVDVAILFCEYSPKSTGIQPVEDLIPILSHNPDRFRLMANLNPHLHYRSSKN